ncbi:MAG: hypothetical protein GY788_27140, partial [bacterium]|nr:hypothetical protein [bacterium]
FATIPRRTGSFWLGVGLAGAALWYALRYLDSYGSVDVTSVLPMGVLFPLWEALVCVGLSVGLLVYAREHWNHPSPWLSHLGAAAYGVFLIHIFVVVGLNYAFLPIPLPPMVKFVLVAAIGLLMSFALVVALRKIPGVARVI